MGKEKNSPTDTIIALATPRGKGAIAIIRLSGPNSQAIVSKVWQPSRKDTTMLPGQMQLGWVVENPGGEKVDQALVVVQKAPHSYTGEDTAELHVHGSPAVIDVVLDACLAAGARLAEPGEFTKRAYLHNRLSASQAEAVGDLVAAESKALVRLAADQLAGGLDKEIDHILRQITTLASQEAAYLDFSEEDIAEEQTGELVGNIAKIQVRLTKLIEHSSHVPVLRDGFRVALVGLPNAGKSTLLNTLVGFDRAITSEEAGTTRDTIDETIILGDVPIRLIDTAGLNSSPGKVEKIGIERTMVALEGADLVLILVAPGTREETESFLAGSRLHKKLKAKTVVYVNTKVDQKPAISESAEAAVSVKTGQGMEELKQIIIDCAVGGSSFEGSLLTTKRQIELAKSSLEHLTKAQELLSQAAPRDIVLVELESASHSLAAISGVDTNDAMITNMFANFCIGK